MEEQLQDLGFDVAELVLVGVDTSDELAPLRLQVRPLQPNNVPANNAANQLPLPLKSSSAILTRVAGLPVQTASL